MDKRVVSFGSRRQKAVALSSFESEYYAAATAVLESLGIVALLREIQGHRATIPEGQGQLDQWVQVGGDKEVPLSLHIDSRSARSLCCRLGTGRLKHVPTKALWLQQLVSSGSLRVLKVRGELNPADVMTKLVHEPSGRSCLL